MSLHKYDVCVCGGGPAGFIAAIAAARRGARTVLLEKYGFPGGMATAGLVGPISKFNFGGRRVVGGIPLEFVERLSAGGGAIATLPSGNIPFDAEAYKLTAQEMLLESGAEPLFHTTVHTAKFDGDGCLQQVQATAEGTPLTVAARVFVDATGTGTLIASRPGLARRRNLAAANQPLSLIFILGGVDTARLTVLMAEDDTRYAHAGLRAGLTAAVEEKRISGFGGPWTVWGSVIRDGQVSVNCTRYGGDVTDPIDFSRAEIAMRREVGPIVAAFRRTDPAFAECFLIATAATAGYRESREIAGTVRLTGDDILAGAPCPDPVALGAHPVDRHLPGNSGQNVTFLSAPYPIPYRTMTSPSGPNLLAAGALIAADPVAYASLRVQAQCMATGQAAGTAAALCAGSGTAVTALPYRQLSAALSSDGALLAFPSTDKE